MEWKTVKLGEVCEILDKRRIPLSSMERESRRGKFPYYGAQGIIDYIDDYIFDEELLLVAEDGANLETRNEDIAIIASGKYWVNNHAHVLKDNGKLHLRLLHYLLNHMDITPYITGSAQPKLNQANLIKIELSIPDIDTQRRIAAILSSLDDKIENNNRINRNLEAQAQALFKSWFVDFEPWGGKMPDDWREGVYNDIIEKTISGDWGKERPEGNYDHSVACIRGCDFEDINNGIRGKTPQRYILEKNYQNKGLKNRDIVVEISGGTATVSTGRVCLITEKLLQKYDYDIVCTNFCRTIRPLANYYTYLYYSWKYKYDQRIMFGYENGTSGIKNFAIKDFIEKEPLIIPSCDVVKSFNNVISVLHDKSQENGTESSRLATLRDTLLPKLMKGEIAL